ncbi:hypothetical protein [Stutzerimonas azotifigens]|uniref:hypothetical protein n=1 Tax=Stutzerimonas azotifigens TaxID=291995 RepID=UPI0005BCCD1E|nr:hypothetical protein [Stutzerimonas azotifigens]
MSEMNDERRQYHALRTHLECLLSAGASILTREPLTLLFQGRRLSVAHGMLVGESGATDLIEILADTDWPDATRRQAAMDLCVAQLNKAMDSAEQVPSQLGERPKIVVSNSDH